MNFERQREEHSIKAPTDRQTERETLLKAQTDRKT